MLGKDAGRQLVGGHFEAEEGNRRAGALGRLDLVLLVADEALRRSEGDVGRQLGLPHARTPGKDGQIALVRAADLGVDSFEPGGDSGRVSGCRFH